MKTIWKFNFGYAFFRPYVQWGIKTGYSRITVKGLENIPDCSCNSVFFPCNHCNTLMDPLVLLQSRKEPTAFLARADIFGKPFIARILNNLKILPVYRNRDCNDSSMRNKPIFDNVVECVEHGTPVCMYPEGTHRTRRSLLPLKKGVLRMAQLAALKYPERPVYLVPAGLDYEDYFNNMTSVTLTYGEPMRIYGGEDIDEMVQVLRERMSQLITFFPDDENLDAKEVAFYESRRRKYGILHWILAILLLPFFIVSGFLCLPMLLVSVYLISKLKDRAWMNTVRFATRLVLTPFTVAGALIAGLIHMPWFAAIIFAVAVAYAQPAFYRILVFYKKLFKA